MPNAARIDVHTHVVPPFWGEALPSHGGDPSGWATPSWSPEAHPMGPPASGCWRSSGVCTGTPPCPPGRTPSVSFLAFADHERILFGSHFPYAPAPVAAAFNRLRDAHSGLTDEQKTAFNHGNAKKIFTRLT
ncbi:amidohydrolase family protein [Streptomyces naphthomycinicus]|uniref:amidohydrolase family protein n=1 Tax=Streptomyces naphthomycinicus TaxID=2872625 RepID=UPI001CEDDD81|nr:amidohydrolase family protein [Streptomyces sp. TML10]